MISINKHDTTNSITGFTLTLYFAGCEHKCKGCFSQNTWNYNQGKTYSVDDLLKIIKENSHNNISLIGGDIFYPLNRKEGIELIKKIKSNTNKQVYVWTGYSKEEVEQWIDLSLIDYLIEGKFILEKRDIRLALRGSSNQRIFCNGVDKTQEIDNM